MKSTVRLFLLSTVLFTGCETAHNVAVSGFRVIDTPNRIIRRHLASDSDSQSTTTTTTTYDSDVVNPGHPVENDRRYEEQRYAEPPPRVVRPRPSPTRAPRREANDNVVRTSATPTARTSSSGASAQGSMPTGKPVPGKPGYVFSPFDSEGRYVDVTGYTSGQKVKDPYSGKVFLVP